MAVRHPRWYTVASVLFGLLFVLTSVAFWAAPAQMVPSVFASFDLTGQNLDILSFALAGTNVRNLVLGGAIVFFALRDTRTLLLLLILRFLIECGDLIGNVALNPDMGSVLPAFVVTMGWEVVLLVFGRKYRREHAR